MAYPGLRQRVTLLGATNNSLSVTGTDPNHQMLRVVQHPAWLAVAASIVFFARLGDAPLWDQDEPKNAQCACEMLARGDWILPTFNEATRYDKPALLYWLMMSAYQLLGVNEFAARCWSALLSVGTTLITLDLGRTLFGARVGRWSGWIMAGNLMFVMVGRAATPDAALIFCTTLAMSLFARGTWGARTTLAGANALADFVPRSRLGLVGVYAAMSVGALAKGPVAIVLPMAAIACYLFGCYLIAVRPTNEPSTKIALLGRLLSPRGWWAVAWKMRPGTALLVIAAIALPWYAAVAWRTDGDWLAGFLGQHNVRRFLNPLEGHRGSVFYYVPALWIGLFPWSIFLLPALLQVPARVRLRSEKRVGSSHGLISTRDFHGSRLPTPFSEPIPRVRRDPAWSAWLFLTCWAGVWIGFFTLSGTKLPSYVLPAYPALAVLIGAWADSWLSAPRQAPRWALVGAWLGLIVAGSALAATFLFAAERLVPGEQLIGLPGLVLVAAGVVGWRWSVRRPALAAWGLAAASIVFVSLMFSFSAVRVGRHQNGAPLARLARRSLSSAAELATFEFDLPSLVFYAGGRVPKLVQPPQVADLFARSPQACLVTSGEQFRRLGAVLPDDVVVLARQPRFLQGGEVLLLGRATETARQTPRNR